MGLYKVYLFLFLHGLTFFSKTLVYAFFAEMRRYKVPLFFKIHVYTIFAETRNYKVSLFRPKTSYNF